jgi:hypothetical protein
LHGGYPPRVRENSYTKEQHFRGFKAGFLLLAC